MSIKPSDGLFPLKYCSVVLLRVKKSNAGLMESWGCNRPIPTHQLAYTSMHIYTRNNYYNACTQMISWPWFADWVVSSIPIVHKFFQLFSIPDKQYTSMHNMYINVCVACLLAVLVLQIQPQRLQYTIFPTFFYIPDKWYKKQLLQCMIFSNFFCT